MTARLPLVLAGAALLAACAGGAEATQTPTAQVEPTLDYTSEPYIILDYISVPYEQIIDDSQAIFVGQVLTVSGTSWNQDSGQYWYGGLPTYSMDVQVLQKIVDTLALPEQVTISTIGYSPAEPSQAGTPAAGPCAVFFVIKTQLAWRTGLKAVLRWTNRDTDSTLPVGEEGCGTRPADETARVQKIVDDVAARREIIAQP